MPTFVFPESYSLPAVNGVGLLGTGSFNGLVWGTTDSGIFIDAVSGIHDMPALNSADQDRPADHGMFAGIDYLSGRSFQLSFRLIGSSVSDVQNKINQVMNAFITTVDELPLTVFDDQRTIYCRCRKRAPQIDPKGEKTFVTAQVIVEMFATDPRLYDSNSQLVICTLPTASGGFVFPVTFPVSFGTNSAGGSMVLTNDGNFETRPVFTIVGPLLEPRIENVQAGKFLKFSILLNVGDYLTVDLDSHAVILNGDGSDANPGSTRRNTLVPGSQWFVLPPGTTNINFRADAYDSRARLTAAFASAWV